MYDMPMKNKEDFIRYTIEAQLEFIGEDPTREGLLDTPKRVIESWRELFSGYGEDPSELFKTFDVGTANNFDQMIALTNIQLYSVCEHHLLPFYGKAHVAYIPDGGRVIGVSKMARLIDIYARRLQIQERIVEQVTDTLMKYLKPLGVGCIIEAVHMCMRCRGCSEQHSVMVTSGLKGVFRDKEDTRAEFLQLIQLGRSD